ncbi:PulJ/GspJ family protein [Polynucleobacter ibericus]|uniref:PulJ/GspJ family protein n=1 Tax=Polynucleobacter ibericus TaxID=1819725 RepID=UPI001BFCF258|nr:hypothetical protein [Polynucleobacter ibericus]QWE08739.1 hypothetical protein AOC20_00495 [Polynucleobacter ibericus]
MDMPSRHISSQSFDEILSDLGDDPAIPDPHGIRKPPPQQKTTPRPESHSKVNLFREPLSKIQLKDSLQGFTGPILLIAVFIAAIVGFLIAHQALTNDTKSALETSQKQISELKKELLLMRDEIHQDQDDLYLAIDEIEVSIHSIRDKKPEIRVFSKPQAPPHEPELRRWRYLGSSQMGPSYQAYFHTGKSHLVFAKGAQVLGDWRLSNIEKELVTLTHTQGKSIVLKASKSE